MKLRLFAVVLALATLAPACAFAQGGGLYLNPIASRIGASTADPGLYSFLGPGNTSRWFYGIDIGGFYDFYTSGSIHGGLEMRDSILAGSGSVLNTFDIGPRISISSPSGGVKPYILPVIGVAYSRSAGTPIFIKKIDYGIYAGIDYRLNKHLDFRALELGYGSVVTSSDGTIGGTASVPPAKPFRLSSGLILRF